MNPERHLHAVPDPSDGPRPSSVNDLLAECGRGSPAAFEELYDAIGGSVFGLALRVVRDRHLAEDVAQEALTEVWRLAPRYRPDAGSARSWILTIAHRRAVDRVRSEQSAADRLAGRGFDAGTTPHPDSVVDVAYAEWEAGRVRAGLASLSSVQREALELAYYQGLTHAEVAGALGVPLGTAKARLRDGLLKLREVWREELREEER